MIQINNEYNSSNTLYLSLYSYIYGYHYQCQCECDFERLLGLDLVMCLELVIKI